MHVSSGISPYLVVCNEVCNIFRDDKIIIIHQIGKKTRRIRASIYKLRIYGSILPLSSASSSHGA
jgi:hypothetical protein